MLRIAAPCYRSFSSPYLSRQGDRCKVHSVLIYKPPRQTGEQRDVWIIRAEPEEAEGRAQTETKTYEPEAGLSPVCLLCLTNSPTLPPHCRSFGRRPPSKVQTPVKAKSLKRCSALRLTLRCYADVPAAAVQLSCGCFTTFGLDGSVGVLLPAEANLTAVTLIVPLRLIVVV